MGGICRKSGGKKRRKKYLEEMNGAMMLHDRKQVVLQHLALDELRVSSNVTVLLCYSTVYTRGGRGD